MPREKHPFVWNKRDKNTPADAVYIGRGVGSDFGNPFSHLEHTKARWKVATREEAVEKYETWVRERVKNEPKFRESVKGLAGKHLVCWCAPALCHGEVLHVLAEELAAA